MIVNLFTGAWKEFPTPERLRDKNLSYSPSLDWVLVHPHTTRPTLEEVQTGRIIVQGGTESEFTWSADGSLVAKVSGALLTIIRPPDSLSLYGISQAPASFDSAGMSPDGTRLFLTSHSQNSDYAYIMDISGRQVREICLGEISPHWAPAVWSRDNRFVVKAISDSDGQQFDLLIDTQEMRAYKLVSGEFQHRIAWLASPQ